MAETFPKNSPVMMQTFLLNLAGMGGECQRYWGRRNLARRDLLWGLTLAGLFDANGSQNINWRADACESLDARAAFAQNCSATKLSAGTYAANSTHAPEACRRC